MKKVILGSIAALCMLAPTTVYADTLSHPTYANTNVTWNGNEVNSAKHLIVTDPWSGNQTSALPLYYVEEALGELSGLAASWDGTVRTMSITLPSSVNVDLSDLPAVQPTVKADEMVFTVNGVPVEYAPYFEAIDPASGKETSYVPIFYLEEAVKRFGVQSTWNGTHLALSYGVPAPVASNSPLATKMDLLQIVGGYLDSLDKAQVQEYGVDGVRNPVTLLADYPQTDPFSDVPASDWPLVHFYMLIDNFGVLSPVSPTVWGANEPVTLSEANTFFAQWLNVTPTRLKYIPSGNINEYMEVSHVDTGIPQSGDLTVGDLNQMVSNLKLITQGFKEVAPNEYEILPQLGAGPVESIAGLEYESKIRVRVEGDEILASFPGLPDATGVNDPWIRAGTSGEEYSVNGGKTWAVAPPQGGGQFPGYSNVFSPYDSPSFTPTTVLMKGTATFGFGINGGYLAAGGVENSGFLPPFVCGVSKTGQFGVDFN